MSPAPSRRRRRKPQGSPHIDHVVTHLWRVSPTALAAVGAEAVREGAGLVRGAASPALLRKLSHEVGSLEFSPAGSVIGRVRQRVDTAVWALEGDATRFTTGVALSHLLRDLRPDRPWTANEVTVSKYPPLGEVTAHRDHLRYQGFVVTLSVTGAAQFDLMADRETVEGSWWLAPGDLVVVRASPEPRPIHRVIAGDRERIAITWRCIG